MLSWHAIGDHLGVGDGPGGLHPCNFVLSNLLSVCSHAYLWIKLVISFNYIVLQVIDAIGALLDVLEAGGYCCGWQLVPGTEPGGWPADWMTGPKIAGDLPAPDASSAGLTLQARAATM